MTTWLSAIGAPPDPERIVNLAVPWPISVQDGRRIVALAKRLGFRADTSWVAAGATICCPQIVRDVVHAAARASYGDADASPARAYDAVRRSLRACVDPEFRKAFWAAFLLGGYEAGGAYLLANAPKRRANRNAKDVLEILDAAWRLHDPEVDQRILNQLNAIPPGGAAKFAGLTIRRGKASGNEWRWWVSSPYLGRVCGLPGEPRRLIRPIFEAEVLAGMNLERPRRRDKR